MLKKGSVAIRTTVVTMVLVLLLGFVVIIFSHFVYRDSATRYNAAQVTSVANAVAGIIDPVLFAESVAGDTPDDYWEMLHDLINTMFGRIEGLAYMYILTPTTDGMFHYYVSSAIPGGFLVLEEDPLLYAGEATDAMRKGETVTTGIFDAGEWGILVTAYAPIIDHTGRVLGLVGIDLYAEEVFESTTRFTLSMIAFVLIGIAVIGITLSWWIKKNVAKPLKELVTIVSNVKAGELNFNHVALSNNEGEIGELTRDVYGLCDVIKSIVNEIARFSHETNILGDIEYRIDETQYHGEYKEIITKLNEFSADFVKDMLVLLSVLNNINDGNFNINIEQMPGKKAILNTTVDGLMANLNGVSAEVNAMIEAATKRGDLNFKTDANKYTGDWHKIMTGLNDIAKAVDIPIKSIVAGMKEMEAGNFDLESIEHNLAAAGYNSAATNYSGSFKEIILAYDATVTSISSYIHDITQDLAAISSGNLTTQITREFIGSFAAIKESLNNISTTLHKTMSEISVASEQVLSGAKQISTSAADLANGAQEQASSIEELNAAVELINQQTRLNTQNSSEANELSNTSTANAREGNDAMQQTLGAMNQIKNASNNISKIIKTIQDIAFQTNLLALNAAVEAARAGEHGKGFAVVAEEVRSLAAKSQEAASETTTLIGTSINTVDTGAVIARATAETLDTLVENANKVLNSVSAISSASQEQAEAISQVVQGLQQISQVVQSNSAVSEETAAASEELNSQAEILRQLVGFFRL